MPSVPPVLRASRPVAAEAAPGRRRFGRRLLHWAVASTVASAVVVGLTSPAQAATPVYIGATGDIDGLAAHTGQPMARHVYTKFDKQVPADADMITVSASSGTWRSVANAGPGSALYNDIVRWAKTIKSRPGNIMVAYHHEPEVGAGRVGGSNNLGTAADYIAAYRKVVSIFRAQGVKNVEWTWQMSAYSFRVNPSDRRAAANWYPGNAWVDNVGADGYNWASCDGHSGAWLPIASFADPVVAFARAHGKRASLPEFGSMPGPRRAEWLKDAHQYLIAHRDVMSAAFYYNKGANGPGDTCTWILNTPADFDAFRAMARDTAYFRS
jgi:hypothetical protein